MTRLLFPIAALLAVVRPEPIPTFERVPVRIGLKQQNLERAYDYVLAVSDPSSNSYGRHWSHEDVDRAFRPHADSATAVLNYLRELGIDDALLTPNGYWITLSATPDQAAVLRRLPDGHQSATRGHVEYVDTTSGSGSTTAARKRQLQTKKLIHEPAHTLITPPNYDPPPYNPDDLSHCATNTTPTCIRALYGIPKNTTPLRRGDIGVFETEGTSYTQHDLNDFFARYAPEVPKGTHPYLEAVNGAGGAATSDAGAEADLDFETVYGLVGNSEVVFLNINTAPNSQGTLGDTMVAMLDAVDPSFCSAADKKLGNQCGSTTLPKVLSISYSEPELASDPPALQARVCNEFMKLALKGHTVVVSSGDYGVASNPLNGDLLCVNTGCIPTDYHDPDALDGLNGTIFSPAFPSNCPYVLSVGATMIDKTFPAEASMNLPGVGQGSCDSYVRFSSGGGFANYFPRPSYQSQALSTYFAQHNPPYKSYTATGQSISGNASGVGANGGIYARNGRGIPDVSAIGTYFDIYVNGAIFSADGTSAATPVWASVVALLNREREVLGKAPVGFVNPALYQHPEAFHDVVRGNSPGCLTEGFAAVEGWDPSTGLGTPDFEKLLAVFTALP